MLPPATKAVAAAGGHVDFKFVAAGGGRYVCDARAADPGALVEIHVLPPGARGVGQAVAQLTLTSRGMALGVTAVGGGDYTLRVVFGQGTGAVTASVAAVGTALHRAPAVDASGLLVALGVACYYRVCQLDLGGAGLRDGDGSAAVVRLEAAEGTAYAVAIGLAPGARDGGGAHVAATFFPPAAAAGAAGFPAVLAGPLGAWRATPPGHHSFFAHHGCAEGDYPWRRATSTPSAGSARTRAGRSAAG